MTTTYHILKDHEQTLVQSKDLIKEHPNSNDEDILNKIKQYEQAESAILLLNKLAYDDEFNNIEQFRQYLSDKIYWQMLNDNLLRNDKQRSILASRLLQDSKKEFIESAIRNINQYLVTDNMNLLNPNTYQELIMLVNKLVLVYEDENALKSTLNEIAQLPVVKNNSKLRAYLGEKFAVKTHLDQDPAELFQCYDLHHDLNYFKPDLFKQVQEQINLSLLANIKQSISKKIFIQDGLVQTVVPVSMKGIQTQERMIDVLLFRYDSQGELTIPNGPGRVQAQEFCTGALKDKEFLGAIRIKKLQPNEPGYDHQHPNNAVYKIVDGIACETLLKQFKQVPADELYRVVKLYGLEGQAAQYLTRAILFAKRDEGDNEANWVCRISSAVLYWI